MSVLYCLAIIILVSPAILEVLLKLGEGYHNTQNYLAFTVRQFFVFSLNFPVSFDTIGVIVTPVFLTPDVAFNTLSFLVFWRSF